MFHSDLFYCSELVRKLVLDTKVGKFGEKALCSKERRIVWFSNKLPELTVQACPIHHISPFGRLLLECISNLREIGQIRLNFIAFQRYGVKMCCHEQSCECSFRYCIPISVFKAIEQLLMGFCILKFGGHSVIWLRLQLF